MRRALPWMLLAMVGCASRSTTHGTGGFVDAGVGGSGGGAGGAGGGGGNSAGGGSGSAGGGGVIVSGDDGGNPWWQPPAGATFYWELANAPPTQLDENVGVYDIDGFDNDAGVVAGLHARGLRVVCYMDAGTWEPDRPDAASFPASLKGNAVDGWPDEDWLDVRPSGPNYAALQAIMTARFQICADKGFDGVEPDNIDSFDGNDPGFPTTAADQLAYDEWIATTVHGLGLAVFQKNDTSQTSTLQPYFDGMLDEQCNQYSECDTLVPYVKAGKPAWNAEYSLTTDQFCDDDVAAGIIGAQLALDLDGSKFNPCANDVGLVN